MSSAIPGDNHNLLLTLLVTVVWQLSFFAIAATFRFDKVTDFAGGTNFVLLAVLTCCLTGVYTTRQVIITLAIVVWGVRLSGYLLLRILAIKEDKRFDEMRDHCLRFFGFWFFQILWVWIGCLAVVFVNSDTRDPPLTAADYAGVAMMVVGFLTEFVADQQKFSYRNDTNNKNKWCDIGVWKYSRHPNYFGELLFWWGVFTASSPVLLASQNGWGYFTVLSPLFMCFVLLGLSGMPILEPSMHKRYGNNEAYRRYLNETSILIPLPNSCYAATPTWFRQWFLFEWPAYQAGLDEDKQENDGHKEVQTA